MSLMRGVNTKPLKKVEMRLWIGTSTFKISLQFTVIYFYFVSYVVVFFVLRASPYKIYFQRYYWFDNIYNSQLHQYFHTEDNDDDNR